MSRVYTSKPAVSRQSGAVKEAQKTPQRKTVETSSTKPKQNQQRNSSTTTTTATSSSRRVDQRAGTNQRNRTMNDPGYSGGAYGHGHGRGTYQNQGRQNYGQEDFGRMGHPSSSPPRQQQQNGLPTHDPSTEAERRLEYRGGYSVIPPDERKRRQIEEQARRETEEYERFKQQRKPARTSYVGTPGGGLTESQSRSQAAKTQSLSKYASLQKRQQYRDDQRRREDKELQEKKDKARQQTQRNEMHERERQRDLDRDRRVKNDAFLRRLEGK